MTSMNPINFPRQLHEAVADHQFDLLFATVSGAHLYGFPSPDSDYDLRGVHIIPLRDVVGLDEKNQTVSIDKIEDGLELDLVTHDVKKFFGLMLRKNGYVLEQLYSPLVVHSTPEYEELKLIGLGCVTRHHSHHYLGFSENQWRLFIKEDPPRVKPLLYVYRVLLTGIHLMRTGVIEANLIKLNEEFQLSYVQELIDSKISSQEKHTLQGPDLEFHFAEVQRLRAVLQDAFENSHLPEVPAAREALDDLLKRIRLKAVR